MLLEYEPQTNAARAKVLKKGEMYFYIFFVGTRDDCRGRGKVLVSEPFSPLADRYFKAWHPT